MRREMNYVTRFVCSHLLIAKREHFLIYVSSMEKFHSPINAAAAHKPKPNQVID